MRARVTPQHGYHLGEHGEWEKKSNFDLVVRVPLLISAPWKDANVHGAKTASLTELVDVMPTVAALAGLPPPPGVDGTDMSTLLDDPNPETPIKTAAYHQYPACGCKHAPEQCYNQTRQACNNAKRDTFNAMGYTVRVADWRYTAWLPWNGTTLRADWDGPRATELYDHKGDDSTDMDAYENVNVAAQNQAVAQKLHAQLRAFFDKEGPAGGSGGDMADASDPYDM